MPTKIHLEVRKVLLDAGLTQGSIGKNKMFHKTGFTLGDIPGHFMMVSQTVNIRDRGQGFGKCLKLYHGILTSAGYTAEIQWKYAHPYIRVTRPEMTVGEVPNE